MRERNSRSRYETQGIGFLERLPKWLICVPLLCQWLVLAVRYRSAMLPSLANPHITSGGLVGEGKTEYFDAMGETALAATARHGSFVVDAVDARMAAENCLRRCRLEFPLIAKPDIGWCGFGVRRIDTRDQLNAYVDRFPRGERLVLQAYIAAEGEAGIFYARRPDEPRGQLIGLALRYFPRVIGDGHRTIAALIAGDMRLRRLGRDGLHQVHRRLDAVPSVGEVVRLSTIGSTRVGGLYRDGTHLITPELSGAIEAIAFDMQDFYFGRFDVRFESEDALRAGLGFTIIEVNGAGSEAIEAWDPSLSPIAAFAKIFRKQSLLFRVAADNRQRGYKAISLRQLAQLHLRQQRLIPRYPRSN